MKIVFPLIIILLLIKHNLATTYVVGVNIKNKSDTINIKERFLIKEGSEEWNNGSLVIPFEISDDDVKNSIIKLAFILRILKMDENEYNNYWMKEKSKGRLRRPVRADNFKMIKRYLERESGGIGYLPEHMVDTTRVKIIERFSL